MKKYIILLLVYLQVLYLSSQNVAVHLSIDWRPTNQIFSNDSLKCDPYLNITYKNITRDSIYFLKPTFSHSGFPQLPRGTFGRNPINYKSSKEEKSFIYDYSKNNYKVIMYGAPYCHAGWEIISDSLDFRNEHEIDVVNDVLADFYELTSSKFAQVKNSNSIYEEYKSVDVNAKGILNKFKDNFCFLKSGEIEIDSYNLAGFEKIRGHFIFQFDSDGLYEYLFSDSFWDNKGKKWEFEKIYLPKRILGYDLYFGKFISNSIDVKF